MARSAYETLYKVLMNINEDSCRPCGMASAIKCIHVIPRQMECHCQLFQEQEVGLNPPIWTLTNLIIFLAPLKLKPHRNLTYRYNVLKLPPLATLMQSIFNSTKLPHHQV